MYKIFSQLIIRGTKIIQSENLRHLYENILTQRFYTQKFSNLRWLEGIGCVIICVWQQPWPPAIWWSSDVCQYLFSPSSARSGLHPGPSPPAQKHHHRRRVFRWGRNFSQFLCGGGGHLPFSNLSPWIQAVFTFECGPRLVSCTCWCLSFCLLSAMKYPKLKR